VRISLLSGMRPAATRSSIAIGDRPPVRSIWWFAQNRPWCSARSRHDHRIAMALRNPLWVTSNNGGFACWPWSGSPRTIDTVRSASTLRPSPACTSKCSKRRSSARRRADPSTPCASADEGRARRRVLRHNDRFHERSCGGSPGTRRPWWPRTAAPVGPRQPRTLRPTSPSSSQQCPQQQANDDNNRGGHHQVVGRFGDELAIRVEAHGTSIVPFPWKPSRSNGRRASSRSR
jgi:hypothetical protein